jgi:hypothetical protein
MTAGYLMPDSNTRPTLVVPRGGSWRRIVVSSLVVNKPLIVKLGYLFQGFFFSSLLWCTHKGDHWQEELAKFGYKLERKIEKKRRPHPPILPIMGRVSYA